MSAPDWLLPARSIPVWVGSWALLKDVYAPKGSPEWTRGLVTETSDHGTSVDVPGFYGDGWADPGNIAPDLSNPDTFAAARDRLAVACGMDRSDGGTAFLPLKQDAGWVLWSIWAGVEAEWATPKMFPDIPKDASRELALALAWQKVVGA